MIHWLISNRWPCSWVSSSTIISFTFQSFQPFFRSPMCSMIPNSAVDSNLVRFSKCWYRDDSLQGSLSDWNWSLNDFILKTSLSVVSCFQISFKIVVKPARRIKLKPLSNNSILSFQLDFNSIVCSRFWILWSNYFNFVTICCAVILKNCYRPWQLIKMVAQLQRLDEINKGHLLLCNNQKWININAFLWIIFYFL